MNDKLTLQWIIDILKKSGINSKQVVIERLEKARIIDLKNLKNDIELIIHNDLVEWNKNDIEYYESLEREEK